MKEESSGGDNGLPIEPNRLHTDKAPPTVTVDYEKYERYLAGTDLSDDQKREFIAALWQIITAFVDLGFGVHPVQQAQNTCGKLPENSPKPALSKGNAVNYESQFLINNFENAADLKQDSARGGFKT